MLKHRLHDHWTQSPGVASGSTIGGFVGAFVLCPNAVVELLSPAHKLQAEWLHRIARELAEMQVTGGPGSVTFSRN